MMYINYDNYIKIKVLTIYNVLLIASIVVLALLNIVVEPLIALLIFIGYGILFGVGNILIYYGIETYIDDTIPTSLHVNKKNKYTINDSYRIYVKNYPFYIKTEWTYDKRNDESLVDYIIKLKSEYSETEEVEV